MQIPYSKGMKLQLWVQDTGALDGYAIYIDKTKYTEVFDGQLDAWDLARPATGATMLVVVQFGGVDGGKSALVDNQGPQHRTVVAPSQDGMNHVYEIVGA